MLYFFATFERVVGVWWTGGEGGEKGTAAYE